MAGCGGFSRRKKKDTLPLVLKISVTCQGHHLYAKNYGKLDRDELMSFTLSILSANEFFTVFKLNMHLNSRPKNKYTYSKQYNCKIGGRWLTSLTDNILLISVCVCVLVTQSCLTPCDPKDCSLPGSSVHGILQARILECSPPSKCPSS